MNFLTTYKRDQLRLQHKRERDKRVCDRIKAILLYDEGWTPQQIAKVLLISDQAVREHVHDYRAAKKLHPESGGSEERLSKEQSEQLEAHLREHTYLYVRDISAYVKATFGVVYTIHGLRNWLQRHGFSYKKPAAVPGKADKKQQQEWLAEYEKLKAGLPEDETICFIDGVHPTHNVQPAYGWIKKGVRKEIPANAGRARLNLSGSIDVMTHNVVIQEDETLNAESTIRFFQKLEDAYPSIPKAVQKLVLGCVKAPAVRRSQTSPY